MKKLKFVLLCIFLLYSLSKVYSYPTELIKPTDSIPAKKHDIAASIGIINYNSLDVNASPLIYKGILPYYSIRYRLSKRKIENDIQFNYANGFINCNIPSFKSSTTLANFSYSFFIKTNIKRPFFRKVDVLIGGSIGTWGNYTNYYHAIAKGWNNSWYLSHSLDWRLRFDYNINQNNKFGSVISYPVISFVVRPDYSLTDRFEHVTSSGYIKALSFGNFKYPIQNNFLTFNMNYLHTCNNFMTIGANYQFIYISYPHPRNYTFYSNALSFLISIKF